MNEHEKFLKRMKVTPENIKKVLYDGKKRKSVNSIPSYACKSKYQLSNDIGNGFQRKESRYTGNEIMGIATLHKSNAVPIRKGTNNAKEISQMRRG